jgi:ubiquinone/menaquinone biosynthesis C-methylase UbiE
MLKNVRQCYTLKEIYRILKPGGIFVMETPRYDTLMFKLLGNIDSGYTGMMVRWESGVGSRGMWNY